MLHMADDWIVPIREIKRSIRPGADGNRTKIRILPFDDMFKRFASQSRAILSDLHVVNTEKGNDIQVQKIALEFVRKMSACQNTCRWTRTRWSLPELLHAGMFPFVEIKVAAESGSEISVIARGIGHKVVAPGIENPAVW